MTTNRSPEQITAEIDDVRGRMDATLEELEHRLNVRRIVRDGLTELGETEVVRNAAAAAARAGRTVREHPVPTALAGAGLVGLLAWGMVAGSHARRDRRSRRDVALAVQAARERLGTARQSLADASSAAGRRMREAGSEAWQHIGDAGSEARAMARKHPMTAGAIGLALLALALAASPAVRDRIGGR